MKRIALFFLIACLCCSFVACDMGNGLVAELIGDLKEQGNHVIVEPSVGLEESGIVAIDPIEPWGTVEIQTTPPYEIETEYGTAWNTTSPPETEPAYTDIGFELDALPHHTAPIKALLPVNADTLEDWQELDCAYYHGIFDQNNLIADVGELTGQDGFVMYMAADTNFVYFAFAVNDETRVKSEDNSINSDSFPTLGDHFTISLDIGGLGQEEGAPAPVQYSFGPHPRGVIYVGATFDGEDTQNTRFVSSDGGDYYDLMGGTRTNNGVRKEFNNQVGWRTEFAIHWVVLLDHLKQNYGESFSKEDLNFDDLLTVMNITYVDVDSDGNVVKSYRVAYPLQLSISAYQTSVIPVN